MKKYIFIFIILFSVNAFACCGCAVVESAMKNLSQTFKSSLVNYDETSSKRFDDTILAKVQNSINSLNKNFIALKDNTSLEILNNSCIDEINVYLQKTLELKNIEKTQQAIIEFEKDN